MSDTSDRPAAAAADTGDTADHTAADVVAAPPPTAPAEAAGTPGYGSDANAAVKDVSAPGRAAPASADPDARIGEAGPAAPRAAATAVMDAAASGAADDEDGGADASDDDDAGASDDEADEEDEDTAEEEQDAGPANAAPRVVFSDLGLSEPVLRAVAEAGYVTPTPIQEQAIPVVLMGRDVLGTAQTGTGKTAGFTLPMLDILSSGRAKARMPRSLILEPTRELALQVAEQFEKYGKHLRLNHALLIGGESMNEQREVLEKGVDVLIATPGRLLDLFERGRILLADCKLLVIDEADRMLDMGFIPDVERIVSLLPGIRQTLFFSATMAPEIRRLSDAFLSNPKEIAVSAPATVASTIVAGLVWVREHDKREALRRLVRREQVQNALVFCNRKIEVDVLYKSLRRHGFSVGALHGDMDQPTRFATLNRFKAGELQLLVCSDVAARGLDIGGLSHVFNFDVPFRDEDYVHRIGRTGRAGREGHAFTIATADDARLVAAIETLTGKPIPRMEIDGLDKVSPEEIAEAAARPRRGGRYGRAAPSSASRSGAAGRGGSGERRGAAPDGRRERGEASSGRGGRPRRGEGDRPAPPTRAEAGGAAEERSLQRAGSARGGEAQRDDRGPRDDRAAPRDDRGPREDVRRRGAAAGAPDRRGPPPVAARDERGRGRDEPRRAGGGDDRGRRFRDDLGPAVRGFGDGGIPAFMTIPVPRPRRDPAAPQDVEGEAAEAA